MVFLLLIHAALDIDLAFGFIVMLFAMTLSLGRNDLTDGRPLRFKDQVTLLSKIAPSILCILSAALLAVAVPRSIAIGRGDNPAELCSTGPEIRYNCMLRLYDEENHQEAIDLTISANGPSTTNLEVAKAGALYCLGTTPRPRMLSCLS